MMSGLAFGVGRNWKELVVLGVIGTKEHRATKIVTSAVSTLLASSLIINNATKFKSSKGGKRSFRNISAPTGESRPRSRYPGDAIPLYGARCLARSEEHTSELQSLMRISYAVFC